MNESVRLEDRLAIWDVKARYCRFLDSKQWDSFAGLFTDDAILDVVDAGGPPAVQGRDNVLALVKVSVETAKTAHQVHNPEIAFDGETAEVIWAMQDRVVYAEGHGLVGYGHYTERYRKQGGVWKIAHLKLTRLHVDLTD